MYSVGTSDGLQMGKAAENGTDSDCNLWLISALLFMRPESLTVSRTDTWGDYI